MTRDDPFVALVPAWLRVLDHEPDRRSSVGCLVLQPHIEAKAAVVVDVGRGGGLQHGGDAVIYGAGEALADQQTPQTGPLCVR